MPNPLGRAATEALLDEADKWLGMGRADRPYPTVQRASDDLIVRLTAALRAAHAALDGATGSDPRLAAFGRRVLDTFAEYWGDVDGCDLQAWAVEAGALVGYVKQPLPDDGGDPAASRAGANGLCNGQPCSGETEPGETCYHIALDLGDAALDGATVERMCACGHGEPHHFGEDAKRCAACVACDAFQPTHERLTVTRALVVPE